jgi:hypothetical protein
MKKWTKKFLNKTMLEKWEKEYNDPLNCNHTKDNAEKAFKKFGIPKDLWMELSEHHIILQDIIKSSIKLEWKFNMAFMCGFLVGWKERMDDKKRINK